jgi:hypothetical protein
MYKRKYDAANPFNPSNLEDEYDDPRSTPKPNTNTGSTTGQNKNGAATTSEPTPKPTSEPAPTPTNASSGDKTSVGIGGFGINAIIPHKPDYQPFTETRTVLHEWEGYCSVNNIQRTSEVGSVVNGFDLILNHIQQPFVGTFVKQTDGSPPTFGLSVKAAPHRAAGQPSYNARRDFPRRMIGATADKEVGLSVFNHPTWKWWYEKMYNYWTPLSCNYNVTVAFNNFQTDSLGSSDTLANTARNMDVIIGVYEESYVASNTSDIKPYSITTANLDNTKTAKKIGIKQYEKIKGIRWYKISNPKSSARTGDHVVTISGTWRPGERLGSIRNIQDMKQWYTTGTPPDPLWNENVSFVFLESDYTGCATTNGPNVNCRIEMQWVIQYKELNQKIKYKAEPTHGNDAIHLRIGMDDIQFPYPVENHCDGLYNPTVPTYPIS